MSNDNRDIMDDAAFEQMMAEAARRRGVAAVWRALKAAIGARHPLDLDAAERAALLRQLR